MLILTQTYMAANLTVWFACGQYYDSLNTNIVLLSKTWCRLNFVLSPLAQFYTYC